MAEAHVFVNITRESVVYAPDGRTVDSEARITANPGSPAIKSLVAQGVLLDEGPEAGAPDAEAGDAADAAPDDAPADETVEGA